PVYRRRFSLGRRQGGAVIRVLVADGSERIRANLLRRLAAEEDITVCGIAEDGEHALQEALHLVPDIAVLDAGLTGLDGVQTTEMLAEYAPQAGGILMSMESGSELFPRAGRAGGREDDLDRLRQGRVRKIDHRHQPGARAQPTACGQRRARRPVTAVRR